MTLPPKDFTPQEQIIAQVLDEFGIRYSQGQFFLRYVVDFLIAELGLVIEADGVYGHFAKRDMKRDLELMGHPSITNILHVKDVLYVEIKETIWQALNRLEEPNPEKREPLNRNGYMISG